MNQENKQLPTASQSLYKWNFKLVHEDMAKCIDEHTRLHTDPLREELEKLRAWKESAMKTLADVDIQECGKLLNVGLGQSISDKIVPGIKELKAENERLNKVISDYSSQVGDLQDEQENLSDENYGIMVENQNLRKALELLVKLKEIKDGQGKTPYYQSMIPKAWSKAKEALKR